MALGGVRMYPDIPMNLEISLGYLEDHPRTCKWLGSPPFINH